MEYPVLELWLRSLSARSRPRIYANDVVGVHVVRPGTPGARVRLALVSNRGPIAEGSAKLAFVRCASRYIWPVPCHMAITAPVGSLKIVNWP